MAPRSVWATTFALTDFAVDPAHANPNDLHEVFFPDFNNFQLTIFGKFDPTLCYQVSISRNMGGLGCGSANSSGSDDAVVDASGTFITADISPNAAADFKRATDWTIEVRQRNASCAGGSTILTIQFLKIAGCSDTCLLKGVMLTADPSNVDCGGTTRLCATVINSSGNLRYDWDLDGDTQYDDLTTFAPENCIDRVFNQDTMVGVKVTDLGTEVSPCEGTATAPVDVDTTSCEDGFACTQDTCDPAQGCIRVNNCCGQGGGCCTTQTDPGCSDTTCCQCVCGLDPSCCSSAWDGDCTALTLSLCVAECPCSTADPIGACCDHGVPDGACTDDVDFVDCLGGQLEFFEGRTCADIEASDLCLEHTGACCDRTSGCTNDVPGSQCTGLEQFYFKGQSCADVAARGCCADSECNDADACTLEQVCDPSTGQCQDAPIQPALQACCGATGLRGFGSLCTDLAPDCCTQRSGTPGGPDSECTGTEGCCRGDDCENLDPVCCTAAGGSPQGSATVCTFEGACCANGTCISTDELCCDDAGGTFQGQLTSCFDASDGCCTDADCDDGDPCTLEQVCNTTTGQCEVSAAQQAPQACCLTTGICEDLVPDCCTSRGGMPQGIGTSCTGPGACCIGGGCQLLDPVCCVANGGAAQGAGTSCTDATDGCCTDADCDDGDPCTLEQNCNPSTGQCEVSPAQQAPQACCGALVRGIAVCTDLVPECCLLNLGTPGGIGTQCTSDEACCSATSCSNGDPICCAQENGTPQGPGTLCGQAGVECSRGACCDHGVVGGSCQDDVMESQCTSGGNAKLYVSDPNLAIPDNQPAGISNTIMVPDNGTILDLDIDIVINHTWVGDLCVTLTHGGTTISLVQEIGNATSGCNVSGFGCSSNNLDVILDDEGLGGALDSLPCGGTDDNFPASPPNYTALNALAAFDGMDKAGDWTLTVSDNASADTGTFVHWSLHINNSGSDQLEFFNGITCAQVEQAGLCDEHTGACCDRRTAPGQCLDDVLGSQCDGPDMTYFKGETCDEVAARRCCSDLECDDGVECTRNVCLAVGQCLFVPDNFMCDDGNECTIDTCCNDTTKRGDTCDILLGGGCLNQPFGGPAFPVPCDDGNLCTEGDICINGECVGMERGPADKEYGVDLGVNFVEVPDPGAACVAQTCPAGQTCIDSDNNGSLDLCGITHTLNVPTLGAISDVDVSLSFRHIAVGDLRILVSHGGTTVVLLDGVIGGNANDDSNLDAIYRLDDEGGQTLDAAALASGDLTISSLGSFRPDGLLSAFDGMEKHGEWTLSIVDEEMLPDPPNFGIFKGWTLHFVNAGGSDCDDGDPCTDDHCDPATGMCDNPPNADTVRCCGENVVGIYCADFGRECCVSRGGTPSGPGSACEAPQACCREVVRGVGSYCEMAEPECCRGLGGMPGGIGSECAPPEELGACCEISLAGQPFCEVTDPLCCSQRGGTFLGADTQCNDPTDELCCTDAECNDQDPCTDDSCGPNNRCVHSENAVVVACCLFDFVTDQGSCVMTGRECCLSRQGSPDDTGSKCSAAQACCVDEENGRGVGSCFTLDPLCCNLLDNDPETIADSQGPGTSCDDPTDGCCANSDCNDMIACTLDECVNSVCVNTPNHGLCPDDFNICTAEVCDPTQFPTGCGSIPVEDANGGRGIFPCDDGDPCTVGDHCNDGTCMPGTPRVCNDQIDCTNDSCDPATPNGCVFEPNDDKCDDMNVCTRDVCCVDSKDCPGSKNELAGCFHVPLDSPDWDMRGSNGIVPCDDMNACTTDDRCQDGVCEGGPPPDCDDDNPCTTDKCIPPDIGCQNNCEMIPPTIMCPEDVYVPCTSSQGAPVDLVPLEAMAMDNCGPVTVFDNKPANYYPPSCPNNDPTVVSFWARDGCGNESDRCTVRVFVEGVMCCPSFVDTELTLMPPSVDLRQDNDGPVTTKANFDIWNENERRFSGTHRCLTCWDSTLLSLYGQFRMTTLHTHKAKARVDGLRASECPGVQNIDSPLLGVVVKQITFPGRFGDILRSAITPVGSGVQSARIRYDVLRAPESLADSSRPDLLEPDGFEFETYTEVEARPGVATTPDREVSLGVPGGRGDVAHKGSLLYWPRVQVRWNAQGDLIEDTFLTLANDFPQGVDVLLYFVNGDPPLAAKCTPECRFQFGPLCVNMPNCLEERAHPGWNRVGVQMPLTPNQPTYWSTATGQPAGKVSFGILDPGVPVGRPDPDPANPGGRMIRGFVVGWAVTKSGKEVNWNHLTGNAMIIHYLDSTAFEYNAWAFQCVSGVDTGVEPDAIPGQLNLNGVEYESAADFLVFDFYTVGSNLLSHPARP